MGTTSLSSEDSPARAGTGRLVSLLLLQQEYLLKSKEPIEEALRLLDLLENLEDPILIKSYLQSIKDLMAKSKEYETIAKGIKKLTDPAIAAL